MLSNFSDHGSKMFSKIITMENNVMKEANPSSMNEKANVTEMMESSLSSIH